MAHQKHLTKSDVTRLLGDVSDQTVARIVEIGGSPADLEIAYFCFMGDDDRREGELGPLDGTAAKIFSILRSDPMLAPNDEER